MLHKGLRDSKGAEIELRQLLDLCSGLGESADTRDLKYQANVELVGLLSRTERYVEAAPAHLARLLYTKLN